MSEQSEQKNKMSKKHLILMILCCVVPMGVILVLFALGTPLNRLFLFAIILICPLSHMFMMRGMKHHEHDDYALESKKIEAAKNKSDIY